MTVSCRLKKSVRPVLSLVKPYTSRAGTALLGRKPWRELLNHAYERRGPLFGAVVTQLFSGAEVPTSFVWKSRFGDKVLSIPVFPSLARSWINALNWRWPQLLPTRAVYEWYLQNKWSQATAAGGPTLLDVGANDGMHTYPFAAHGWRCVSFEPQPKCIDYITRACRLNGFDNVEVVQAVVTNEAADSTKFFVSDSSWFSSLAREHVKQFEPATQIAVPAVTLDGYCGEHRLTPTCVKIDVEGAERQVLEGSRRTIASCRPDLFIEVKVLSHEQIRKDIWEMLEPQGYHMFLLTKSRRRPILPIHELHDFLAARHEHGAVDIVALAEGSFVQFFESHFLSGRVTAAGL